MITSQSELDALCARLAGEDVVGLDTEYLSDRRFYPELCLIQLTTRDEQVLIDPLAGLDLSPLGVALAGPSPVVIVHSAASDVPIMVRATGHRFGRVFDTMVGAGFLGCGELSLRGVVRTFVGAEMGKGSTLTDWARRPLPEAALEYAIEDVVHLAAVWDVLCERLTARGRLAWAEDETVRVVERALVPPDPDQAWRKLDSARRLRGPSLAVAAEVAAWRVRTAMAKNRPVRRILGDLAVMAIAESRPTTIAALGQQRGVDRGVVRDQGGAIVAAVRRGLDRGRSEWPERRPAPPPESEVVHNALGLAARMVAQSVEIAPWLAYERADLGGLADDPPTGRLAEGWRAEILAPPLLDLLHGRRALTIENGRLSLVTVDRGST